MPPNPYTQKIQLQDTSVHVLTERTRPRETGEMNKKDCVRPAS